MAPSVRGVFAGANGASTITLTLTGAQNGDTVLLFDWNNFYTLAGRPNPTGTAVSSWGAPVHTLDGGTDDCHLKIWVASVTAAGGTIITHPNTDEEIYACAVVFVGSALFDKAASTDFDGAATTSHVAPDPGTPATSDDVLVCTWMAHDMSSNINYTLPGGMTTAGGEQEVAGFLTAVGAYQTLASGSAPGTRTATADAARVYGSASALMKDAGGGGGGSTLTFVRPLMASRPV